LKAQKTVTPLKGLSKATSPVDEQSVEDVPMEEEEYDELAVFY
jgi:hypothetical protein